MVRLCRVMLLASAAGASAASAVDGIDVHPAAEFATYAPVTAYDMVQRLPGFTLVDVDADVRGYAGAQGNLLIDGARPSSKRDSIEDVLARIPAHAVERIELIHAGAGFDMFGHALLANVVRRERTQTEITAELGAAGAANGWLAPVGQFDIARQRGDDRFEASLSSAAELDEDSGRGRIVATRPDGTPDEASSTDTLRDGSERQASATWTQATAAGEVVLFSSLRDTRERERQRIDTLVPDAEHEAVDEYEDLQEAEAGLRYTRALGARNRLDAVLSAQRGWLDALSHARSGDDDERFEEATRSGEDIARVDLRHERDAALTFSAGLEAARNMLDGDARLSENGESIALPGSRVRIEEHRAEAVAGASWRASDAWHVDADLRIERSLLRQTGDSSLARDFTYMKPRLAASWQMDARQQWRASLSREVGQLDFTDFVASASLDTDTVSAGNARLEPDTMLRATLAWERRFGRDGALVLTWHHDAIKDAIDRVPVRSDDDVFDAPGNIGDATRDSLVLEFGSTLDRFGWPNLRLDASVIAQHSRVRDPTTGEYRGLSEEKPLEGEIELSHALPALQLTWGAGVDLAERETEYRHDEIATERVDASWDVFVERGIARWWRVRAELTDPLGREIAERRERYDGLRSDVPLETHEWRTHRLPPQFLLTLRRETGG